MKSTLDTEQAGSNDLDAVLAEARERGVSRAVEILSGREMLSAVDFLMARIVFKEVCAPAAIYDQADLRAFVNSKMPK